MTILAIGVDSLYKVIEILVYMIGIDNWKKRVQFSRAD